MAVRNKHSSASDGKVGKWTMDEVEEKVLKWEGKEK